MQTTEKQSRQVTTGTRYFTGGPNSTEIAASEFYDRMAWQAGAQRYATPWWDIPTRRRWKQIAADYNLYARKFRQLGL